MPGPRLSRELPSSLDVEEAFARLRAALYWFALSRRMSPTNADDFTQDGCRAVVHALQRGVGLHGSGMVAYGIRGALNATTRASLKSSPSQLVGDLPEQGEPSDHFAQVDRHDHNTRLLTTLARAEQVRIVLDSQAFTDNEIAKRLGTTRLAISGRKNRTVSTMRRRQECHEMNATGGDVTTERSGRPCVGNPTNTWGVEALLPELEHLDVVERDVVILESLGLRSVDVAGTLSMAIDHAETVRQRALSTLRALRGSFDATDNSLIASIASRLVEIEVPPVGRVGWPCSRLGLRRGTDAELTLPRRSSSSQCLTIMSHYPLVGREWH
jgi:DNA-directed RNA polymerase specialized sigma24 family protein